MRNFIKVNIFTGFLSVVLMALSFGVSAAQTLKVPAKVQNAFKNKFPHTEKVQWGMENAHEYEADFKVNGRDVSANFTRDGKWVETEFLLHKDQLPGKIKKQLKSFQGFMFGEIDKTIFPNKTIYEVEIKKAQSHKDLIFNSDGDLFKTKILHN